MSGFARAFGLGGVSGLVALAGCASHDGGDPFVAAFKTIRPCVVLFTMQIPSDDPKKKGQWDDAYGSGILIASGSWGSQVLTVEHVIRDARNLRVTLPDKKIVATRVIARDANKDLALTEIATPSLPVATLGSAKDVEPGMPIGVAGFPIPDAFQDEGLGVATSVYAGRVSSVREDSLELDLPVIPGESGGPVFDGRTGVVIALAESRFEDEKAIGFGIPIDDAIAFLKNREHT